MSTKAEAKDTEGDEAMKEGSCLPEEVRLGGRVIPLKSNKLREAWASLQNLETQIEKQKNAGSDM